MPNYMNEVIFCGTADRIMGNIFVNVALAALCLSPLPTMWRIWKRKCTEGFLPYPYMASLLNCFFWILYSSASIKLVSTPFRFQSLYLSSLICGYFSMTYNAFFWMYSNPRNRYIVASTLPITFVLLCAIAFIWNSWSKTTSDADSLMIMVRAWLTGPIAVVSGIIMYASPLSIMKNVYETNSVEYLPYWPCWAYILNGLVWLVYACLPPAFEPYIAITNGVGALLGILQLGVYYKFRVRSEDSSTFHLKV